MMDFLHAIGMVDSFWQPQTIMIRLVVAAIFGAIIGFEREMGLHSAGLRTHIIVAVAAALYTILMLEIFHLPEVMTNGRSDPGRSIEAVTAGIAFLGAGAIFRRDGGPRGLTTGAGMWLAGALGMSAALGHYLIGLFVCVLAVIVLSGLKALDKRIERRADHEPDDNPDPGKDRT